MSVSYRRWKGKSRAVEARDEGAGGTDGIVLPLDLVGSGVYDAAYTLPVKFGSKNQQFSLQIDTGSSDLWVASSSCSTSSCQLTHGRLYNPSDSRSTGVDFNITYLEGSAAGPVVWDKVTVGGYSIENQALAAVNDVRNEPLGPDFSGILGLALPLNSIIASDLPPVTTNDADGAAWASNLFSITPVENAPSARFISLSLSRPGSDQIPAQLGIGRHPASLVNDPSKIKYTTVIGDSSGVLFWKSSVRAITVYVNGVPMHINIGRSFTGAAFPTAVLDSGVPVILTTPTIANGIYGALGIGPASDGQYYVPCKTPLNMSITIDTRPEIPLHPLDLTAEPPNDNQATDCIGLIQAADLKDSQSAIGDMILGVPFLRNVYTVMAYTTPDKDGNFAPVPIDDDNTTTASSNVNPRLGLLSLTDPARALDEFNTVRVLNQPISSSGVNSGSSAHNTNTVNVGGTKMSVGVVALIGVLSFFGLCAILFLGRWVFMRRRYRKAALDNGSETAFGVMDKKAAYMLARNGSGSLRHGHGTLTEDELREIKYHEYLRKEKLESMVDSERTMTTGDSPTRMKDSPGVGDEFGFRKSNGDSDEPWDPSTAVPSGWAGDATLVGSGRRGRDINGTADVATPLVSDQDRITPPSSPDRPRFNHHHNYTDSDPITLLSNLHRPQQSVDVPLLSAQHNRNTSIEPAMPSLDSSTTFRPPPLPSQSFHAEHHYPYPLPGEFGELEESNEMGMAGVGTASRNSRAGSGTHFQDHQAVNSLSFNRESLMPLSSSAIGIDIGNGPSSNSISRRTDSTNP